MALDLKQTSEEQRGCRQTNFWDESGTYDALTNPTGYGDATTVIINDIDRVIVDIYPEGYSTPIRFTFLITNGTITSCTKTMPNGTNYVITLTNTTWPFTEAAPFIITGEELGYGVDSDIPFGAYRVEYYLYDGTTPKGSSSADYLYVCQVERAVKNLSSSLDPDNCDCDCKEKIAFKSRVFLDSAKWSMENNEVERSKKVLKYAYYLATKDCKC